MSALLFDDAEIISRYTRAQAIEYGILVDMTAEPFGDLAREAGLKWPIAMTATAFNEFVAVDKNAKGHAGQDVRGRFWDVVFMFKRSRREVSPPRSSVEACCSRSRWSQADERTQMRQRAGR